MVIFAGKNALNFKKNRMWVVTNPPFSLFREYVAQPIEHNKKFLIIGTWNAITYRDVFKLGCILIKWRRLPVGSVAVPKAA